MGANERMKSDGVPCVVCGFADARGLFDVRLVGGVRTVLCGSHALMHRRGRVQATTEAQLKELLRNRRETERRESGIDELGAKLTLAFAGERRTGSDRRGR